VADPDVKYTAIIPTAATSIANGIIRASGLTGTALGTCGGLSTPRSPRAIDGSGTRGSRTNSIERSDEAVADSVPSRLDQNCRMDARGGRVTVAAGINGGTWCEIHCAG
jgi:hypothetical protein